MIRVMVVDEHPLVRDSLTDALGAAGDIAVVDQCADGSEVAEAVARTHPEVLLINLRIRKTDGLTAGSRRARHPSRRPHRLPPGGLTSASAHEARMLGASGYLLKDDDPAQLAGHVRIVASGGTAWHPRVRALLTDTAEAGDPPSATAPHNDETCPRVGANGPSTLTAHGLQPDRAGIAQSRGPGPSSSLLADHP